MPYTDQSNCGLQIETRSALLSVEAALFPQQWLTPHAHSGRYSSSSYASQTKNKRLKIKTEILEQSYLATENSKEERINNDKTLKNEQR